MDNFSEDDSDKGKSFDNQHYDEALDVADQEEVTSLYTPTPRQSKDNFLGGNTSQMSNDSEDEFEIGGADAGIVGGLGGPSVGGAGGLAGLGGTRTNSRENSGLGGLGGAVTALPPGTKKRIAEENKMFEDNEDNNDSESSGSDDDDDDDDDQLGQSAVEGAYDPAEYEHLQTTPEIKELFQYITRYSPQVIELETRLKPFIPDYIPAVGDIDAFLKVDSPDHSTDMLGLVILDEPCSRQTDPTILELQLRSQSKQYNLKKVAVKSIESKDTNPKTINTWIDNIRNLHRTKPMPNVHYNKPMPDIDDLMEEWPEEIEEYLKEVSLPTADIDCSLSKYTDMVCAILDIPVYDSKIQSLYLLFNLYSEFKNSQHFNNMGDENYNDNSQKQTEQADTLIL